MKFRLTDIFINNFYGYKEAKFSDLKNYNVLIGKNNAGKSNLFRVLNLLQNLYNKQKIEKDALYDKNENLSASIDLTFELSKLYRKNLFNREKTKIFLI